jgi:hypothetical protein
MSREAPSTPEMLHTLDHQSRWVRLVLSVILVPTAGAIVLLGVGGVCLGLSSLVGLFSVH